MQFDIIFSPIVFNLRFQIVNHDHGWSVKLLLRFGCEINQQIRFIIHNSVIEAKKNVIIVFSFYLFFRFQYKSNNFLSLSEISHCMFAFVLK